MEKSLDLSPETKSAIERMLASSLEWSNLTLEEKKQINPGRRPRKAAKPAYKTNQIKKGATQ